jgi:predicted nucleic acid-binding protein
MGLTALDTSVLVAFLDKTDVFHSAAVGAVMDASEGETLLPAVAYTELMVGVLAAGATPEWFDSVLDNLRIRVGAIDRAVAGLAAALRAESLRDRRRRQWRTPDALVVAESIHAGADVIATTDTRWPAVPGNIEVRLLAR